MEEGQEKVEESQNSRTPFVTTFHPRNLVAGKIIRRNLPDQLPGTFPCNRTSCRTCSHVNSSSTITTPKGHVNITGHFSCITENVVYCLSCTKCLSAVYIGETGRRLADPFREHRRDVINGRNDLPVPAYFNQANHTLEEMKVAVLKAGQANQEYRKKQEMTLIFNYGTVGPSGLNRDLKIEVFRRFPRTANVKKSRDQGLAVRFVV